MKNKHEAKLDKVRWMCGSKLKERKKKEIKQLLGLEPVSLVIKTDYDGLDMLDRQMTLTG